MFLAQIHEIIRPNVEAVGLQSFDNLPSARVRPHVSGLCSQGCEDECFLNFVTVGCNGVKSTRSYHCRSHPSLIRIRPYVDDRRVAEALRTSSYYRRCRGQGCPHAGKDLSWHRGEDGEHRRRGAWARG